GRLLCREDPPADAGGIGAYMSRYAHALAEVGCTVTVVTAAAGRDPLAHADPSTRTDAPPGTSVAGASVVVVEIPVATDARWIAPLPDASDAQASAFHALGPSSLFGMAAAAHLPALHERHAFDIVESPETGAGLWFILNSRRVGADWRGADSPLFVTHIFSPSAWIEQENRCPATSRGELALRWMEADAARWSDAVVCSSHDLAAWAERNWSLAPSSVVIFPPPIGPAPSAIHPAPSSPEKRLVYVGRLEPRKGVDVLLAAFARAADRVDGLHLDLVGQDMIDPRTNEYFGRRSIQLNIPEQLRKWVHLVGPLAQHDLDRARNKALAAIVPGGWDNYPYTCVEAMAWRLPIIGARSGGVEQLVRSGQEGILFEPGDIEGCADAMVTLATMDPDARRTMGENASTRVRVLCDNRTVATERLQHYDRLVTARTAPAPTTPRIDADDAVLVNAIATDQLAPLANAVRSGLGFALGWARTAAPPGIIVSPSPTAESLAVFAGPVGPIAVAKRALLDLGEDELIESGRCDDPRSLIMRLISMGLEGAVIPEVNADATAFASSDDVFAMDPLAPVMAAWNSAVTTPADRRGMTWRQRAEAAEGELVQLRASRTMKLATGIRRLTHLGKRGRASTLGSEHSQ
ncbi:MAG: glycosyltransferase family 4 protein, partial [Planctomycetes bacterium]|nr:glycosyltransferase family 4 protein [Planctomycetota bacterium]